MRRRIPRSTSRISEIITFWSLVIVCSVVLSVLAFAVGKYWVGGLMARSKSSQATPRMVLKTPDESKDQKDEMGPERVDPPSRAVVKVQERAATDAEKSEIEQMHPQDAADLHKAGKDDTADTSTGGDEKPLHDSNGSGASDSGRYSVVTGSFRQEDNAQREVSQLADLGYDAHVVEIQRDGQTFHRVVVGSYASRPEAEQVRDRLQQAGKSATVSAR